MPRTMLADCAQLYPFPVAVWCTKKTSTGPVYSGASLTIASLAPQPARVTIRGTGRAGSATTARRERATRGAAAAVLGAAPGVLGAAARADSVTRGAASSGLIRST